MDPGIIASSGAKTLRQVFAREMNLAIYDEPVHSSTLLVTEEPVILAAKHRASRPTRSRGGSALELFAGAIAGLLRDTIPERAPLIPLEGIAEDRCRDRRTELGSVPALRRILVAE